MRSLCPQAPLPGAVLPVLLCLCLQTMASDRFATPEILKDNVTFWKKIYTEVSLKEGLLHDRDYPLIIYKRFVIGDRAGRSRSKLIEQKRAQIEATLTMLASEPPSAWDDKARTIRELLDRYAPDEKPTVAIERIRFQQGQKERYCRGLVRSGAYIDTIRAILAQYGVPAKLAYLPHVESSFIHNAYSKVGASGLWQFMRGTGKLYLKINYLVDERRDPVASTYAAAKLLSHNHSVLKSWPLAITAYNHGLYGMKRAVAQTGSRDLGTIIRKHRSRSFKFASKNFYGCFLAASEIAESPEKYFGRVEYASPRKYHDITLTHYIRPSVLAAYLNISKRSLAEFNPAIRTVVFHGDKLIPKGTTVHLPLSVSPSAVQEGLAAIPDSLKKEMPPRLTYYRVRKGDNLYGIAGRLHVSAISLALENNITRMNRIYAGQVLRIPGAGGKVDLAPAEPGPVVTVANPTMAPSPQLTEELGDTLKSIVMAAADTVPGQERVQDLSFRFDAEIYDLDLQISPVGNTAVIHVSVDETLGHYAEWLGIPTWRLRRLNRMGNRSSIRIGQHLSVPGNREALQEFIRHRIEYHMALEEDFYSQYRVTALNPVMVRRGQTLWDVCGAEGTVSLWLIKKYNKDLDPGRIAVNDRIWTPVLEMRPTIDVADAVPAAEQQTDSPQDPPVLSPSRRIQRLP